MLVAVAASSLTLFNTAAFRSAFAPWPPTYTISLASRFTACDIAHYLVLSRDGYVPGSRSCAFYPLWPEIIRLGSSLTGGRPLLVGLVLANALSLLSFWMLYRLVGRRYGWKVGRDALILVLAFPGALFFSFPYTESLYLVLVLGLFLGLESGRWVWSAIAGFLMPLARPVGVFVVLPLAWYFYARWAEQKRGNRELKIPTGEPGIESRTWNAGPGDASLEFGARPFQFGPCLLVMCPLLGYAAYFWLMHLWTGNALEGFEAQQSYPNSPSIGNMFNCAGFLHALANVQTLDGMMDSALDRASFLLVIALLPLVWRLDRTWFFYTLPAGLVPALTSWFMSYRRYTMVLFPVFIVLAQLLGRPRTRFIFWYYVACLAALQAWAVKQFVNFNWAG
jgi:hypothetical protein